MFLSFYIHLLSERFLWKAVWEMIFDFTTTLVE